MAVPALYAYRVEALVGDTPPAVHSGDVLTDALYHGWRYHIKVGVFDGTTVRRVGTVKTRYIGKQH
jgi:hypothetical protein